MAPKKSQQRVWSYHPPKGALGLSQLPPADSRHPSEHTWLFWGRDLTLLREFEFFYMICSPLGKPSVNSTPPERGSWHGAAPAHPLVGSASCIWAPQGGAAAIPVHSGRGCWSCCQQDWHCHRDPPWWAGTEQGAPSLTLPWVCSVAPSSAASPDWGQLGASNTQPPCIHLPNKPRFSGSKMRVVLLTYERQKCRRLWLNNLPY